MGMNFIVRDQPGLIELSGKNADQTDAGSFSNTESFSMKTREKTLWSKRLARGEHRELSMRELIDKGIARRAADDMENAPRYILRPTSRFVTRWDLITASALVWTAVATPFEVAFLPEANSMADWMWICNRLIDVTFLADMVMQFFLMYK